MKIPFFDSMKSLIIQILRKTLNLCALDQLSHQEMTGNIQTLTEFKFIRKNTLCLPFKLGRTIRGVKYDGETVDPFIHAIGDLRCEEFSEEQFIKKIIPFLMNEREKKIKDFLPEFQNSEWAENPIWTFAYPWEILNIDKKKKFYAELLFLNRQEYSTQKLLGNDLYARENFQTHALQFKTLFKSLKINGYIPTSSFPKVNMLINDKTYRWVMSGDGNHRMYLLNAFGNSEAKV